MSHTVFCLSLQVSDWHTNSMLLFACSKSNNTGIDGFMYPCRT